LLGPKTSRTSIGPTSVHEISGQHKLTGNICSALSPLPIVLHFVMFGTVQVNFTVLEVLTELTSFKKSWNWCALSFWSKTCSNYREKKS
jgi:hypothetical protein